MNLTTCSGCNMPVKLAKETKKKKSEASRALKHRQLNNVKLWGASVAIVLVFARVVAQFSALKVFHNEELDSSA